MRKAFYSVLMVCSTLLLAGCGGFNVWPFGASDKVEAASYKPANSDEYLCEAGKKFYVRNIENGAAVWLILPDREVALKRVEAADAPKRYSNGITTLNITGTDATLDINATTSWKSCKQTVANNAKK